VRDRVAEDDVAVETGGGAREPLCRAAWPEDQEVGAPVPVDVAGQRHVAERDITEGHVGDDS
jgi:hypothetical protein